MLHCLLLLDPFISYLSPLTLSSAPSVLSLPPALPSQGPLGAQGPDGPTGLPGRQGPPGEKVCHTCQHTRPPSLPSLNGEWSWVHTGRIYRIAENFRGGKLSRISQFCGYTRNLSRGVLWRSESEQSAKVFSAKIIFFTKSRNFSPSKVYHYIWYQGVYWMLVLTSQVGSVVCALVVEGPFSSQTNH